MKNTAPRMPLSLSQSRLLQSGTAESDPWHGRMMPLMHKSAGSMLTVFGLPLRLKAFVRLKCWASCLLSNAVAAGWTHQDMDTVFSSCFFFLWPNQAAFWFEIQHFGRRWTGISTYVFDRKETEPASKSINQSGRRKFTSASFSRKLVRKEETRRNCGPMLHFIDGF